MLNTIRERWRELLLEGGAVLLGVLVAFAVDSYGEELSERRSEKVYLDALADELQQNSEQLRNQLSSSQSRIKDVENYLSDVVHAPEAQRPTASSVNEMLWTVGPYRVVAYQRGALDDLLTSGGIVLVQSDELRRGILSYARLLDQERVRQEAALGFFEDHMARYYYENASFFDFMKNLNIPGESLPGALNIDAFFRSMDYSNLLIERRNRDRNLLQTREELAEQVEVLRGSLARGE